MRVNIAGVWHDAEVEPIQIELTDKDKKNIENMQLLCKNYVCYPDSMTWEEVKKILNIQ